ncbi:unnamed protein product, partial [Symbiodinium microadriaticum]
ALYHAAMSDEPERADPAARRGRDTDFQLRLAPRHYFDQSVQYLLLGVILGALGFVIAVIPMIIRGFTGTIGATNLRKTFLPATVSELVSKWDTVEARIFFGFEVMAALSILLSWYPYKLRNANCIPLEGGCYIYCCGKCCSMSWAAVRQFCPPVGLMLVACVPSVKEDEWSADKLVLVVVHCFSALLMFCAFLLAEAHALSLAPFRCRVPSIAAGCLEYKLRYGTWLLAAVPYVVFAFIAVVDFFTELHPYVKITSFVLEVDAGLAMLANHFVIWAFAPERTWGLRDVEMSVQN